MAASYAASTRGACSWPTSDADGSRSDPGRAALPGPSRWAPAARRRHETSRAAPLIWVDSGERVVGVDPRVGRQRVGGAQRLVPGALLWAVRQVVVVRAGVAALLDAARAVDAR